MGYGIWKKFKSREFRMVFLMFGVFEIQKTVSKFNGILKIRKFKIEQKGVGSKTSTIKILELLQDYRNAMQLSTPIFMDETHDMALILDGWEDGCCRLGEY